MKTGEAEMFVVRRTSNPAADLARGWSAWNGIYEAHPASLPSVGQLCDAGEIDSDDIPDDAADAAEWINDETAAHVRRCPATGLYADYHHDGISSYEIEAETLDEAIAEAAAAKHTWITGGVAACGLKSYHHVRDDIYVFECESVESQADS
jgi:hypothetical protein